MANESLTRLNLHIDDLNKLRIINPDSFQEITEVKDQCGEFNKMVFEFQKAIENIISLIDNVSKEVENEKLRAIGSRNLLKSIKKQRETEQQQNMALLQEKMIENERLKIQFESLKKEESEQQGFINQFLLRE